MNFDEFLKRKPAVDTPNGEMVGVGLDVPMPEQRPAEQELATEGAKMKRRTEWWNEPNYTQAVEAQRKAAMEAAERDVNRAKRERDAALITDMADVFTRMVAQRGSGAWMMPSVENRAGAANEAYTNALRRKDGLAVDYDGKLFQARVQDFQNKRKQQQADREYELAVDKAKRDAEQQAYENAVKRAELAIAQAKNEDERLRAWAKLDNDMKIAGMNNATRMKVQDEITKRAGMYGYGRSAVKEIDLGGGQFIEVDRGRWSSPNKPAIAKIVKQAIINEMSQKEKDAFKKMGWLPISLQQKYGFQTVSDMTTNRLFDKWRDFDASIEYVKKHYGVDSRSYQDDYDNDPNAEEGKKEDISKPNWGESKENNDTDW